MSRPVIIPRSGFGSKKLFDILEYAGNVDDYIIDTYLIYWVNNCNLYEVNTLKRLEDLVELWIENFEQWKCHLENKEVKARSQKLFNEKCQKITEDIATLTTAQQELQIYVHSLKCQFKTF